MFVLLTKILISTSMLASTTIKAVGGGGGGGGAIKLLLVCVCLGPIPSCNRLILTEPHCCATPTKCLFMAYDDKSFCSVTRW